MLTWSQISCHICFYILQRVRCISVTHNIKIFVLYFNNYKISGWSSLKFGAHSQSLYGLTDSLEKSVQRLIQPFILLYPAEKVQNVGLFQLPKCALLFCFLFQLFLHPWILHMTVLCWNSVSFHVTLHSCILLTSTTYR